MKEPEISVGIMSAESINFSLFNPYKFNDITLRKGDYSASLSEGKILFNGKLHNEVLIKAKDIHTDSFELKDAVIGINFHWERKENQQFQGHLKLIVENDKITAINIVLLEDYLLSVISSEMSATSSEELLKAHAVISRSWLLAQIEKNRSLETTDKSYQTSFEDGNEIIRWWDREDHINFDVCADDHCQRYQGVTKQSTPLVTDVIGETFGQVMMYDGAICDTRFYKCCGGFMETFENVWEPTPHPYLVGKADSKNVSFETPDLTNEDEATEWIKTSPVAFCNTTDARILKQVLNDYDQETSDFYRWTVEYSQEELSALIKKRSGIDYGDIIEIVPIERGTSGRIIRLKIIGTERIMTIGKELEIRRTLSESHLYSSAFVVETSDENEEGIPGKFTFFGAGWGHGVGLCQIGAAVMADKGYKYEEILEHYYPGAGIESRY
ncbi:MAG: SpoIID/LytB domain-containing protein [Dysgonamonadaceae bacterium]|nr:SpoIID/LytB domain-containing protein [Dysgonamonadaceae bacterium]MDD3356707.1 SpoIID/LytB domain-containing protein [Dysgonamonadaceae bacterium]MDD3728161.1 SpoIID/LytB domain-containing protein [Dysgonamonadaceae bacterium]MDD4246584.1 SpoIID/LytB domain-containing protein [Dysgonamonadaceae bacterium]HUI31973.1 SpoIID/LytB domain-containing protein [Dysgonamonadaceae bacterium]